MGLLIPDILIINTFNNILKIIRNDYNTNVTAGTESRSILYLLFNSVVLGKYNFYDNAKELLITTPENPLHLEVRLSYDAAPTTSANMIYVTLGSENPIHDSLQIGLGDQDELIFENVDPTPDQYKKQYMRRFLSTYNIVIIGKNRNELLVLFNVFKMLTIASIDHLTMEGLQNIKIGGQDMRPNEEGMFARSISLTFEYEQVVPEIFIQTIYEKIRVTLIADDTNPQN